MLLGPFDLFHAPFLLDPPYILELNEVVPENLLWPYILNNKIKELKAVFFYTDSTHQGCFFYLPVCLCVAGGNSVGYSGVERFHH